MGISVPQFFIENISLPPNVEEMLDKRSSMGIVGNLDQYMKFQTANAIPDALKGGAGGGIANLAASLGAGVAVGQQISGSMAPSPQAPPPLPAPEWFAGVGGQQTGPFDIAGLRGQVSARTITRDTLVWKASMAAWTPAGQVPELAALFAAVPPPLPPA